MSRFRVGHQYPSRDGTRTYTILANNLDNPTYPIAARYKEDGECEFVETFTADGAVFDDGQQHECDITDRKIVYRTLPRSQHSGVQIGFVQAETYAEAACLVKHDRDMVAVLKLIYDADGVPVSAEIVTE